MTPAEKIARALLRLYPRRKVLAVLASPVTSAVEFAKYKDDPVGFCADVLGVQLTPDQENVLRRLALGRRVKVNSGHNLGKGHPNSLVIDTPSGKKQFGELRVGDYVWGLDGTPTQVVGVHPRGVLPVYKVTMDDRSSTVVDGDHLWMVRGKVWRKRNRWPLRTENREVLNPDGWEVISTEELLKAGTKHKNGSGVARSWELPKIGPVQYQKKHVLVSAYTIGVWLGDGTHCNGTITSADKEIWDSLQIDNGGARPSIYNRGRSKASTISIHGLQAKLRRLGILGVKTEHKRVPRIYMENDVQTRLAVLQGLMDTDGECGKGGTASFGGTSKGLVEDVAWLVRSLGGKAIMRKGPKKAGYKKDGIYKRCKDGWGCIVKLEGFPLFRLKRKISRTVQEKRGSSTRYIDSIESVGQDEVTCITVAAKDHMYLTNDFIPTHNSFVAACAIIWWFYTRNPGVVVTTAPTRAHVETVLWTEVRLLIMRAKVKLPDYLLPKAPKLYDHPDHWAEGITAASGEGFQGRHRPSMLFVMDECEGVAPIYWNATDTMFIPGRDHAWLAIGNPYTTSTQSYLEDMATERTGGPKWDVISLSALNHPNVRAELAGLPPVVPNAVSVHQIDQWVHSRTTPVRPEDRKPRDIEWPPPRPCPTCRPGVSHEYRDVRAGRPARVQADVGPEEAGSPALLPQRGGGQDPRGEPGPDGAVASDRCPDCGGAGVVGGGKWFRPGPWFLAACMGIRPSGGIDTVWGEDVWQICIAPRQDPRQDERSCWLQKCGITIGVDASGYGDDDTVFHVRSGPISLHHEAHNGWEPGKSAGRLKQLCEEYAALYNSWSTFPGAPRLLPTAVEVILEFDGGYGIALHSHRGEFVHWRGITVGGKSDKLSPVGEPMYYNLRSEIWCEAAALGAAGQIDLSRLPPEVLERMKIQLLTPYYEILSSGARFVESKDEIKLKLRRSPDDADGFLVSHHRIPAWSPEVVGKEL